MALTNPIAITYGDFTAGGSSQSRQLDGPYVIEKSHGSLRIVFDVILVASSTTSLQGLADDLEAHMRKRDQDLTVSMGGASWTYTHGETILNTTASCTKSGNSDTDRGVSRAYTCVVQGDLPADDTQGLRDIEVHVGYAASRQRTVTMRGVYTAIDGSTASEQYLAEFDAEAASILAGIGGGSVTWELVDEQWGRDRNDHTASFSRQYVQLLANQSTTLDDPEIKDHRIVFTDLSQHPGDSKEGVHRLRRVVGSYDCALDIEETQDLDAVFRSKVRPHIIELFETNFGPQVFAVEDSRVSFDETSKRMSVAIQIIYQKQEGDAVVEVSQSVAIREVRTIDYTPVHGQDEFAAYADVGWATRERVWSRTVIVLGDETPKRRLGERAAGGDAGLFESIAGEEGVDGRSPGVNQDGWNIVSNTSQVTPQWIGDPETGAQIRMSVLTETVVERWNKAPTGGGGGPTSGTGF